MNAHPRFAELADRYAALWNETDAGARRDAIATLWVPEGEHYVRTLQAKGYACLLYTSPSPRDGLLSRMPSSA